ncbi:MAG: UDP-3-O-(3-hydroxymyristoyl)glucosamine N-acyltransferase [Bacteroidales bacterium]|nr:UDP-3-O-(3-hydroxymyristoyl)glucosamine N-acyltransferase [Bacteroidales bacterium]
MEFNSFLKLKEVAKIINCEFIGDPDFIVSGLNEIHKVQSGDITFVDHPKYYNKALNSKATIILINKKVECPEGKALLISKDPFSDFLTLIKKFRKFEKCEHPISKKAEIGEGTIIQPGVFVGNNVKIGNNCLIHANVSIYDHCIIGDNVIIHSNSVIGADAFYFQKRNDAYMKFESCGRVVIADNVEIGSLSSIDKGVTGDTIIGMGTKLDNHIQVGHDTVIGKNCLIGAHSAIAGVTKIEDDVIIWGRVSIDKDLVIGKGTVILATSGVGKSLEGGKTYFGIPAIEAGKKWRELVLIKRLPELFQKILS